MGSTAWQGEMVLKGALIGLLLLPQGQGTPSTNDLGGKVDRNKGYSREKEKKKRQK